MEIFKNIDIQKDANSLAFLINEALEEKAPFAESGQNALNIKHNIKNSYGVITKENEITRYTVTLNVDYNLYNKKTKKIVLDHFFLSRKKKLKKN